MPGQQKKKKTVTDIIHYFQSYLCDQINMGAEDFERKGKWIKILAISTSQIYNDNTNLGVFFCGLQSHPIFEPSICFTEDAKTGYIPSSIFIIRKNVLKRFRSKLIGMV